MIARKDQKLKGGLYYSYTDSQQNFCVLQDFRQEQQVGEEENKQTNLYGVAIIFLHVVYIFLFITSQPNLLFLFWNIKINIKLCQIISLKHITSYQKNSAHNPNHTYYFKSSVLFNYEILCQRKTFCFISRHYIQLVCLIPFLFKFQQKPIRKCDTSERRTKMY